MRKITIITLIIATFCATLCAQDKVLEKSGKKPKWVNSLEKDFIIVGANGVDLQTAQTNALTAVKERVVLSVAEHVTASAQHKVEESSLNNNVTLFIEKFASSTTSQSGKVPFIQGISLSKVEEFYWEKLSRSDKTVYYTYHIKFPFPEFELKKLIFDYQMQDEKLTKQLDKICDELENITSTEQISRNIGELGILADYFVDGRKDRAKSTLTSYKNAISSIELVETESNPGVLTYELRYAGKLIETTQKPRVRSECAKIRSTKNVASKVEITYNYEDCYEDDENFVNVQYRINGVEVTKSFFFDITADKASIFLSNPITFTAIEQDSITVESLIVQISVISKYNSPFTIKKVVLELEKNPSITIDDIDRSFSGKGVHDLKITLKQKLDKNLTSTAKKAAPMLSGYIYFTSDKTGETKSYRIYNHNYSTSW